MTNPPHPGQPAFPPDHGRAGGYAGHGGNGDPDEHTGQAGQPGQGGQGGIPSPRRPPYGPPPQRPPADDFGVPPGFSPAPRPVGPGMGAPTPLPERKGIVGALLDVNFNHLVTPKLIKLIYLLALLLVSVSSLTVVAIGLWVFQLRNGWLLGGLIIIAAPVIWMFEALMVRIVMEAIIVRFKTTEYLQAIKDKL